MKDELRSSSQDWVVRDRDKTIRLLRDMLIASWVLFLLVVFILMWNIFA